MSCYLCCIKIDIYIGMGFFNFIVFCIMLVMVVMLYVYGVIDI